MQALITKKVADSVIFPAYRGGMLDHIEIREELIRQIASGKMRQIDVARALSIAPARVAEMRKRERLVQQDEMPKLARMLGLVSGGGSMHPVLSVAQIPNLGKVAQGVWIEQGPEADADNPSLVPYDRLAGDPAPLDLFAVTPEGDSMNKLFMPGAQLICRRVEFSGNEVRSGQLVIVARMAHDMRELTCKRLEVDTSGAYWLHSESTNPKYAEPWRIGKPDNSHHTDDEIAIIGKVLRAVQNFDN